MAIPNYLERQQHRRPRAAAAAQQAHDANPWVRACRRAREFHLPPSCYLTLDAMREHHRQLGSGVRDLPLLIGYGDGTEAEQRSRNRKPVERPRNPAQATITGLTGLSRRTAIRVMNTINALGLLHRHRMYEENAGELREQPYTCRSGGAVPAIRTYLIGRGGCGRGGVGNANAYHPDGIDPPRGALPPVPRPPASAPGALGRRGRYGDLVDHVREQRQRAKEYDRGP
jgi:hypothetical protein